ncbi:TonB-dependent receptor [Massilibacteroides sp.]|uniref:SusC/RagA family TonB-linked outer membrane protein n=1 Tax=Massilibacteroides sp. TaxID=2034766 RepID=UPI00262F5FC7|nr:TonB-dependent receptor [Massilibacteroides sp.]MDD4514998.1 TonB-dependent receptor [Massilibacteroides sp.]
MLTKQTKKNGKRTVSFLFTLLLLLCCVPGFAQSISIKGTVVDATGEPLIGVNVSVKGTTIGTISDLDGNYTLQAPSSTSVIVFSFIGYKTEEVTVGSNTVIDMTLKDDTQLIDEVVVVGYGVQKKVTVTGAVASVGGEELKASPTTNLSNAMVGRMPGVIGWQRSDEPGGGGTTIRIRGTNSLGNNDPLVVIDGVPGRTGGLNRINPNEIESMSVLKDAAAAIYGSRAANGVILITTKRGKEGKPTVTYTGSMGFSQPTRIPELANAFEYATMVNEIDKYSGRTPRYSEEDLRLYQDGSDPWGHPNTNWYEETVKDYSPLYRHDLSISGGSDRFKFFMALAANGEDGIYKKSANRYDQYSVRVNLDMKVNDYLDIAYGSVNRLQVTNYPARGAGDIFSSMVRSKPILPAYWPSGEPGPDIEYGDNPVVRATPATGEDIYKEYFIQNTLRATLKVPGVEGLTLTGTGSYDQHFKNRRRFETPFTLYTWDGNPEHTLTPALKGVSQPQLEERREEQNDWMANLVATYDRSFGDHNFGVTLGIEAQENNWRMVRATRKYFISDALDEINNGSVTDMETEGYSWKESRINYFGRASYNYLEKYLFEFVFRYDGSYRFPKEKRYGFFPGVSAAWRASEEAFWQENLSFINYFKLRGSISQTGSDYLVDSDGNVDRTIQYLNTYGFGTEYMFGTTFQKTLYPTRTPNPNITWEVGTTYDIGFEFKFLDNRLSLESDLFYQKRTNMLIYRNASLPEISGISLPRENIGKMDNRGIEALVNWSDRAGKVEYDLSFNMTYAKNKLLFWDETPGIPDYQKRTGKRVNTELWYIADGVFNTQEELDSYPHWANARTGDIKYVDVNDDGVIDSDDRVRSNKNSEPPFVFGITTALRWNNFDFKALFQGATGAITYIWRERAGEAGNYYKFMYDNRWTEENPMVEHPRAYNRENEYWAKNGTDQKNTYYQFKTDYLRLKNIELGYTFNFPAIRNAGIQDLRLSVTGTNIFTIDDVKVQDPEANDTGREYPQRRIWNLGVSVTF